MNNTRSTKKYKIDKLVCILMFAARSGKSFSRKVMNWFYDYLCFVIVGLWKFVIFILLHSTIPVLRHCSYVNIIQQSKAMTEIKENDYTCDNITSTCPRVHRISLWPRPSLGSHVTKCNDSNNVPHNNCQIVQHTVSGTQRSAVDISYTRTCRLNNLSLLYLFWENMRTKICTQSSEPHFDYNGFNLSTILHVRGYRMESGINLMPCRLVCHMWHFDLSTQPSTFFRHIQCMISVFLKHLLTFDFPQQSYAYIFTI